MSTLDHFAACARALSKGSGPEALYSAVDASVKALVGHRLFTLLVVVEGGQEVERLYTSDPVNYPLTGRKPLGCGACINVPVIAFGQVIGTMNVLDRENAYSDADVATLELFAPVLALPFARAAASIPA